MLVRVGVLRCLKICIHTTDIVYVARVCCETRNSAIADKTRDAFEQICNDVEKHAAPLHVLPRRFWSFYAKGSRHPVWKNHQNWQPWAGSPWNLVTALAAGSIKAKMIELSGQEKSLMISFGYNTRLWLTDGRTDGHRPTTSTALTHSVAR